MVEDGFTISEEYTLTFSLFVTIKSFSVGGGGGVSSTKTVKVKTIVEDIVDGEVVSTTTK